MHKFFENIISNVGINDIIDIILVAFIIYEVLGFIRESRAEQLLKGLLILVLATFLSGWLNLYTLNWILNGALTLGLVAIVVIFQPELRRGLEYIGRRKFFKGVLGSLGNLDKERAKHITNEFIKAIDFFSESRTGALIVLENETTLTDVAETGTRLDAEISTELLGNIFYEGSPLHDGAVIIRGDRMLSAGCVLPLSSSRTIGSDLGTRHRAGLGITENSDAIAIIVSEETGVISMAKDGELTRFMDVKAVEKKLLGIYLAPEHEIHQNRSKASKVFGKIRGKDKDVKK